MKKIMNQETITRVEKHKTRSRTARNKRIIASFGFVLIICAAFLVIKVFHQQKPEAAAAAVKPSVQAKNNHPANHSKATAQQSNRAKVNSTASQNTAKNSLPPSDYLLPGSDTKALAQRDIANLTKEQLRLARNEIYARHGYIFKSPDLQSYFSAKRWYHEDPYYKGTLNPIEQENVKLLLARENSL